MKLFLARNVNDEYCGLFLRYPLKWNGMWISGHCNRIVAKVRYDYAKKYYPLIDTEHAIIVEYPFR